MQLTTLFQTKFQSVSLLLLILIAGGAQAQTTEPELVGLKGVDIHVEMLNDSERRLGVERAAVYRIVTDALREYKINYLPVGVGSKLEGRERADAMPAGYALLLFSVVAVSGDSLPGYSAAVVEHHLLERVRLERDSSIEIIASVYTGSKTLLMKNGTPGMIAEEIRRQAREFAAKVKAANPAVRAVVKQ
jgi:hypothetical protein